MVEDGPFHPTAFDCLRLSSTIFDLRQMTARPSDDSFES
jgi:hypothetical protein